MSLGPKSSATQHSFKSWNRLCKVPVVVSPIPQHPANKSVVDRLADILGADETPLPTFFGFHSHSSIPQTVPTGGNGHVLKLQETMERGALGSFQIQPPRSCGVIGMG